MQTKWRNIVVKKEERQRRSNQSIFCSYDWLIIAFTDIFLTYNITLKKLIAIIYKYNINHKHVYTQCFIIKNNKQ